MYDVIKNDQIEATFGNIMIALKIFLVMMVSNTTAERSFSRVKTIKSDRRATMVDWLMSVYHFWLLWQ
jgi:hypothetical protein